MKGGSYDPLKEYSQLSRHLGFELAAHLEDGPLMWMTKGIDKTNGHHLLHALNEAVCRTIAECSTAILDNLTATNTHINSTANAGQVFQILKQAGDEPIMPTPDYCHVSAPDQINVYTDGSWLFPLKKFLGLGGAGVW